jgi:hypothetical protein
MQGGAIVRPLRVWLNTIYLDPCHLGQLIHSRGRRLARRARGRPCPSMPRPSGARPRPPCWTSPMPASPRTTLPDLAPAGIARDCPCPTRPCRTAPRPCRTAPLPDLAPTGLARGRACRPHPAGPRPCQTLPLLASPATAPAGLALPDLAGDRPACCPADMG